MGHRFPGGQDARACGYKAHTGGDSALYERFLAGINNLQRGDAPFPALLSHRSCKGTYAGGLDVGYPQHFRPQLVACAHNRYFRDGVFMTVCSHRELGADVVDGVDDEIEILKMQFPDVLRQQEDVMDRHLCPGIDVQDAFSRDPCLFLSDSGIQSAQLTVQI